MNVLKIALIACTLSAAMAHAQMAPPVADQQLAQASAQRANGVAARSNVVTPASKAKSEECVGPVSFCNLYFGS
ncbi:hypothetical protein LFL96_21665 [Paraburkholderia sp. D15]|uniref:hypothetical protein n=1 Tax=Paraburkholderia sp. D15 TaxID=2880218 RepID=UPI00247ACE10|nr:hypothetical protein [Paraburkholderia sp. D15]WGS53661.1 hypothetical protein LFL96_21665 [Paraburkholderia sp. D15]